MCTTPSPGKDIIPPVADEQIESSGFPKTADPLDLVEIKNAFPSIKALRSIHFYAR